jgi:GcrA cell cycle regulator
LAFRHQVAEFVRLLAVCFHLSFGSTMSNARFDANTEDMVARVGASVSAYFTDQEPIEGRVTVVDLTPTTCRWPSGNPRDLMTFRYCGEVAHDGPYCKRHGQLAYLPRMPRAA